MLWSKSRPRSQLACLLWAIQEQPSDFRPLCCSPAAYSLQGSHCRHPASTVLIMDYTTGWSALLTNSAHEQASLLSGVPGCLDRRSRPLIPQLCASKLEQRPCNQGGGQHQCHGGECSGGQHQPEPALHGLDAAGCAADGAEAVGRHPAAAAARCARTRSFAGLP